MRKLYGSIIILLFLAGKLRADDNTISTVVLMNDSVRKDTTVIERKVQVTKEKQNPTEEGIVNIQLAEKKYTLKLLNLSVTIDAKNKKYSFKWND